MYVFEAAEKWRVRHRVALWGRMRWMATSAKFGAILQFDVAWLTAQQKSAPLALTG